MTSFADIRRRNLLRVLLSLERGAEDVTYLPATGGERTVRALVQPARRQLRDGETELATFEEIEVRVSRETDAADSGVTLGGIADPRLRDGLVRSGDDRDRAFSFVQIEEATADSLLIRFERKQVRQLGMGHTQRQ